MGEEKGQVGTISQLRPRRATHKERHRAKLASTLACPVTDFITSNRCYSNVEY